MWLIVGLGNPGDRYAQTRHNAGFCVLDRVAEKLGGRIDYAQFQALTGRARWEGEEFLLAKPQTFMNLSGVAVKGILNKYRIQPSQLVVVHDDMDLPVGRLRLRLGGSPAGHRGLISIIQEIGTGDFYRVKLGIGHPVEREDVKEYVLNSFPSPERKTVEQAMARGAEAVLTLVHEGLAPAMNRFNGDTPPVA